MIEVRALWLNIRLAVLLALLLPLAIAPGAQAQSTDPTPQPTPGTPSTLVAAPTDLTATYTDGNIVLSWTAPENYGGDYQIQRNRPELSEPDPLVYVKFTGQNGVTTYTDGTVEEGVLYVYRVAAVDFFGTPGPTTDAVEIRASTAVVKNATATPTPTATATSIPQPVTINVDSGCTLADAINSANNNRNDNSEFGDCEVGGSDAADTIKLSADVTLTAALPDISSEITIEGGGYTVDGDESYTAFKLVAGADVTLSDVTIEEAVLPVRTATRFTWPLAACPSATASSGETRVS